MSAENLRISAFDCNRRSPAVSGRMALRSVKQARKSRKVDLRSELVKNWREQKRCHPEQGGEWGAKDLLVRVRSAHRDLSPANPLPAQGDTFQHPRSSSQPPVPPRTIAAR